MPCPLQLACRCTLTTTVGREIAKYLIRHGANVNYQDHALRNALYWAVSNNVFDNFAYIMSTNIAAYLMTLYNNVKLYFQVYGCAPELALFLLDAGATVKPYSWLQDDALPTAFIK